MKGHCKMANEKTFNDKQQQHSSIASVQQQQNKTTYQVHNSGIAAA